MLKRHMLLATITFALAAGAAQAQSVLDFELVNSTGYGISEIYVTPTDSDQWGENLIQGVLENGQGVTIEFTPKAKAAHWDIMVTFVDDEEAVYWRGYDLATITTITLHYDRDSGETSANSE